MATEQSTTLERRNAVNIEMNATDLTDIVFALAALNGEITASMSDEEL
ncbi:hypothetical protein [Reyranella soli]|uniref:Uncharacterized protein n=1 Tax=Reyranella soli TaxID=1230389 RepID=A0A512NNC5_9HYPH|nr:hypothetical protein [Reyranella soli]GEP60444.1 hypothetical protein RSO01_76100 [Reyranella soli]